MERHLVRDCLAGAILGAILCGFEYAFVAKFLISGPIPKEQIVLPSEVMEYFYRSTFKYGVIPGAIVGLIGGWSTPPCHPRGMMAKKIGAFGWLPFTFLAWYTQREFLPFMGNGRIVITAVVTFFSLVICLPVASVVGSIVERIRE